jgi:hypothetical protein
VSRLRRQTVAYVTATQVLDTQAVLPVEHRLNGMPPASGARSKRMSS